MNMFTRGGPPSGPDLCAVMPNADADFVSQEADCPGSQSVLFLFEPQIPTGTKGIFLFVVFCQ